MGKFTTKQQSSAAKFDPNGDHRTYEPVVAERPPPEFQLVPIINKTIVQCVSKRDRMYCSPPREKGKRKTFVIHPSQAAGCRRKVFFSVIDAQQDRVPPDPDMERIFAMGHQAHERIQGYLFEAWKRSVGGVTRVWEDVKLKIGDLGVSGELDVVLELLNRHRYLVEIKTASDSVYKSTVVPKRDWLYQTHIYMESVGLKAAILLMENRSSGKMRQFYIPFDDELWATIELETLEVLSAVETRTVPEKTDDRKECFWCRHVELCKSVPMQKRIDYDRVRLPQVT